VMMGSEGPSAAAEGAVVPVAVVVGAVVRIIAIDTQAPGREGREPSRRSAGVGPSFGGRGGEEADGRCTSRGRCRSSRPTQVVLCTQQESKKDMQTTHTVGRWPGRLSTADVQLSRTDAARLHALHADANHTPVRCPIPSNDTLPYLPPKMASSPTPHPRPSPSTHTAPARQVQEPSRGSARVIQSGLFNQRGRGVADQMGEAEALCNVSRVNKADEVQQQPTWGSTGSRLPIAPLNRAQAAAHARSLGHRKRADVRTNA
jgi:hypothetical protein